MENKLSWRQKNHEKAREYEIKYYYDVRREKLRQKHYKDRKCRLCEILMRSEYGGHSKKFYCDSCVKSGEARKHSTRMALRKFRILHPDRVRESYYKWLEKKYVKTS